MAILMNAILTTTVTFSGSIATTSVAFETNDDPGCPKTARVALGTGANKVGVEWIVVKNERSAGSVRKTLVCFPRNSGEKDE